MAIEPFPQHPFLDNNSGWISIPWQQWFNILVTNVGTGGGGAVDSVFGRTGAVVAVTNDYTWAQIDKSTSDLADITTKSHTSLTDKGTNTHAQIDTHIASTANPHSVDIDDVTPTTTKGDIIVEDGSNAIRVAVGTNDQVLTADSGEASGVKWAASAAGLWEVSGGNTQLITADDVHFQNLKAIAMVCDNGTTLPTSGITKGQWFRHTPTGRDILYQYDGSNWIALHSFGSMTVYVDNTDGTDALTHGTAVDSDAFKTIQFAIDAIPGSIGGNVIINANNETYSESVTIQGKNYTGNYSITLQGTLTLEETVTSATVAAGSGATQGTVTSAGDFTGDTYANFLAYFVTDDEYRIIDSHTNDVLTLVGTAPSSTTQNVLVYSAGSKISGSSDNPMLIKSGQKAIEIDSMEINRSSASGDGYNLNVKNFSEANLSNCFLTGVGRSIYQFYASGTMLHVVTTETQFNRTLRLINAVLFFRASKAIAQNANDVVIFVDDLSRFQLTAGSIVDGASLSGVVGVRAQRTAMLTTNSPAAFGYVRVRNCATGLLAQNIGGVFDTVNVQYSGNTTDLSPATGGTDPSYTT